jgi:hypothetical protein
MQQKLRARFMVVACFYCVLTQLMIVCVTANAAQCDNVYSPPNAFLVSPLLTGLASCEYLCSDSYVRCSVSRSLGSWSSVGLLLPREPRSNEICSLVPTTGGLLHLVGAAHYRVLTVENDKFAFNRAAGVEDVFLKSDEIANTFPQAKPCDFWMQDVRHANDTWPRLLATFGAANSLLPVSRPRYQEKDSKSVPLEPNKDDTYAASFVRFEMMLYTSEYDVSLSEQGSRFRDAVARTLQAADATELLALSRPRVDWLQEPLPDVSLLSIITAVLVASVALIFCIFFAWAVLQVIVTYVECSCGNDKQDEPLLKGVPLQDATGFANSFMLEQATWQPGPTYYAEDEDFENENLHTD